MESASIQNCYTNSLAFTQMSSGAKAPYSCVFSKPLLKEPEKKDSLNLTPKNSQTEIENLFNEIQSKQGISGKIWDFLKNKIGLENSSFTVQKALEEYKTGNASKEAVQLEIANYTKSQKKALDFVSDVGATGTGALMFAMTSSLSCSVPFGLTAAAIAGGIFKCAAKYIDARTGDRNYKTAAYDFVSGGVNGLLSPIVNGLGNKVSKRTAEKFNIKTVSEKPKYKPNDNIIEKLALFPKQYVLGNLKEKAIVNSEGMLIKSLAKIGFAFGLRELTFKALTLGTKGAGKNMLRFSSTFLDKNTKEKLKKEIKKGEINFSNDIYDTEKRNF